MTNRQKYLRWALEAAAVAAGFFLLARLGSMAGLTGKTATPLWPASALGMVAVIGGRYWNLAGVTVGSFCGGIVGLTWPAALVVSSADTLAAALAAIIFTLVNASKSLDWFGSGRALAGYVLSGTVAAATSLLVATPVLTWVYQLSEARSREIQLTWWLGDSLAVITLAPAFYSFRQWFLDRRRPKGGTGMRFGVIVLLLIGLLGVAVMFPERKGFIFALFLLLPLTQAWLGEKSVKVLVMITVLLLLLAVKFGGVALTSGSVEENRLILAAFLAVFSLVGLNVSIDDPRGLKRFVPFAVFVAACLTAGRLAYWVEYTINSRGSDRDERLFQLVMRDFHERTDGGIAAVRQGISLLGSDAPVEPERFRNGATALMQDGRLPGLAGFGIIQPVKATGTAQFLAELSRGGPPTAALRSLAGAPAGAADLAVDEHYVISNFDPDQAGAGMVGIDLGTDPERRDLLKKARDSGNPQVYWNRGGSLLNRGRPAYEFYFPVFQKHTGALSAGPSAAPLAYWLTVVVDVKVFLNASLGFQMEGFGFSLYDGPRPDPARLIFSHGVDGGNVTAARGANQSVDQLFGRRVSISWGIAPSADDRLEHFFPILALLGMVLGGALVSSRMLSMREAALAAEELVREKTLDLQVSNLGLREQKAQSDRMAVIVEKVNSSVAILGPDLRFQWVNQAFTKITGYTTAEVSGQLPKDLFTGEDSTEASIGAIGENFKKCIPFHFEDVAYRKDGGKLWVHVAVQPFLDEAGALLNYVGIITDLTERKLAERELLDAKRRAEAANRAKTALIANVSHELRTPLNVVMGNLQLMAIGNITPALRGQVTKSLESCRYLLRLITDLLDVNKAEAGKLKLELTVVEIEELSDEVLGLVQPFAQEQGLILVKEYRRGARGVTCDRLRMKQILVNLLTNAVKYTPAGGRITLRVEENEAPAELVMQVIDTGIGIDPAHQDRIFQEFEQLPQRGPLEGSGLGLPIARRLAELHNGGLNVLSAVGEGSVFTLRIPIRDGALLPAPGPKMASELTAAAVRPSGALILVVDDMPDNRDILCLFLRVEGYRVKEAESGEAALALASALAPQLILMDVRMAGMDGLEAIRRLKAGADTRDIPVISITAFAGPSDVESCLAAGASGYVSKPIDFAELGGVISRTLTRTALS